VLGAGVGLLASSYANPEGDITMRTILGLGISLTVLCAIQAKADNMKLICTGTTTCTAAGGAFAIQQTTSTDPTFDLSNTGTTGLSAGTKKHPLPPSGTAYLAILIPGSSPLTFTVDGLTPDAPIAYTSGRLLSALGESGGNPWNFKPFASTASAATGSTISGFEAYDVALGSFDTSGTVIPVSFNIQGGAFPNGTIFAGFLEDNHHSGLVVDQTPISEGLVVDAGPHSPTPEPTSLLLLGSGLLAVGGSFLRRLKLESKS
jgi:hypothetical protein